MFNVQPTRCNFNKVAMCVCLQVADVFSDAMKPTLEGEPLSTSSERVYFAGSMWCLDLKRYINRPDNTEYVAVYLRRRALRVCFTDTSSWR